MKYSDIPWEDEESPAQETKSNNNEALSFEQMLNQSELDKPRQDIRVGAKVDGQIASINPSSENVLVEIDALHTGVIDKNQLLDDEGALKYQAGDIISAYVVSRQGGEVVLSMTMSRSNQSLEDLKLARTNGLPVKGKVTGENKGGFEVTILGKSCFCPISQIDSRFVQNKADYMGQEFEFLIEKVAEGGRNIVVSRAKLLKKEAEAKAVELEAKIGKEDILIDGTVTEIRDYGAFVDLGGIEGFLHVSEMSYSRVNRAGEFLNKGDKIRVKVLSVETQNEKKRISLSMKAALEDPWNTISENFKEGESYQGKVRKLESFGAFVELSLGVEGLIHISEMSWEKRVHHPSDILNPGDTVNVRILSIDVNNKKISLSLKNIDDDPWIKAKDLLVPGATLPGQVISLKGNGAFVTVATGITGFLPMGALKQAYGESYRKEASPPKEIQVKVSKVDDLEKKLLLTLPNLEDGSEEDDAFREYLNRKKSSQKVEQQEATGSFGAILAAKLKQSNQSS